MDYFNKDLTFTEAKLIYRRLAMLHHPDMGGSIGVMTKINIEFDKIKKQFAEKISTFDNIIPGDIIVINRSVSRIVTVTKNTFTAKSEVTQRYAVFSKKTGVCINNPKFKASIPKKIENAG